MVTIFLLLLRSQMTWLIVITLGTLMTVWEKVCKDFSARNISFPFLAWYRWRHNNLGSVTKYTISISIFTKETESTVTWYILFPLAPYGFFDKFFKSSQSYFISVLFPIISYSLIGAIAYNNGWYLRIWLWTMEMLIHCVYVFVSRPFEDDL